MGRSRGVPHSADDDPTQSKAKRKKTTANMENLGAAFAGQGMSEGKKPLYHCNYCNKDISGKIRIKCVVCPDFDLCIECFSVGAEVTPHRSNHPYRVMDNLSFPLICPEWNADEEILLLEGIEMYGLGNWVEVAEHVGTKSKLQCIDHYTAVYMDSPCFPLPDMSHVIGKSREELLAMGKGHGELKKGLPMLGELTLKEESSLSARVKIEESTKEEPLSDVGTASGAVKKASNFAYLKDAGDNIKVEDSQVDRRVGEKKPKVSGDEEGPSTAELSGFNFKRQEFEVEYDNDAEQVLADMEFKNTDSDAERELKLRVLHIYCKRLDERKHRKDFILERNLLYPDPFEKNLTAEEREMCKQYRVFMRFHSKEEHQELLRSVIEKHRILRRIQDLKEARAAGCRTSDEADRYIKQKRKEEADRSCQVQAAPIAITSSFLDDDEWDINAFPGAQLLSDYEKQLCQEIKILPSHYLNMLQIMSVQILDGNITNKSEARSLFKVEPSKIDKVYDMLVEKGIAQPS